jgi:hypothetical protein
MEARAVEHETVMPQVADRPTRHGAAHVTPAVERVRQLVGRFSASSPYWSDDVFAAAAAIRDAYAAVIPSLPELSSDLRILIEQGIVIQERQLAPRVLELLTLPGDDDAKRREAATTWLNWAYDWLYTLRTVLESSSVTATGASPTGEVAAASGSESAR